MPADWLRKAAAGCKQSKVSRAIFDIFTIPDGPHYRAPGLSGGCELLDLLAGYDDDGVLVVADLGAGLVGEVFEDGLDGHVLEKD